MSYEKEMTALLFNPLGCFSRKSCEVYWETYRYVCGNKERNDKELEEDLNRLFEEYT